MLNIEDRLCPEPNSGCWLWEGSTGPGKPGFRYGDFRRNGRHGLVHRYMYEKYIGPIPPGMHVLHRCDVPICGNPAHLFVGTNLDNIRDSVAKSRRKGVTRNRPSGLTYHYATKRPGARFKLSETQWQEMVTRFQAGTSQAVLARLYNLTRATIHNYLRRSACL